ncbi:MAG: phosphoribosylanthranilate isomerase [Candidatus Lokiarchaeota archaeon]|nr:phosphoribosylanthranilate isomerase [Candidatus Lokiarchaeota archaeon]
MEYIKVCGIKNYEIAKLCIEQGTNAIGFVYKVPSSPRNLKKDQVKTLLNQINNQISSVLVIKSNELEEIQGITSEFNTTFFQIHSNLDINEFNKLQNNIKKKIIIALKVNNSNKNSIITLINENRDLFFAFLLDNSEGHGNVLDINLIKEIIKNVKDSKIILAGGINIKNIDKILTELKPYGIDLSSSLESEKGVKDPNKIKNFLEKIKIIKNSIKK